MRLLFKNLLFTFVVPGTVAVYLPLFLARSCSVAPVTASAVGIILLIAGGIIYAWCLWDFATFGRGTPAPVDAPKRLVARGLYRYSRNPMYVGVLTTILGWAALFRCGTLIAYAAAVFVCFHTFIVLYEERHLRQEFGAEYEAYCVRVGRWLPRMRINP